MKPLLIPAALYFIVTGVFLFMESNVLSYPFQDSLGFLANHAIQSMILICMGICVFLDAINFSISLPIYIFSTNNINVVFVILSIADLCGAIFKARLFEMQELSEALARIGFSLIILGILFETLRGTSKPQKTHTKIQEKAQQPDEQIEKQEQQPLLPPKEAKTSKNTSKKQQ